MKLVDNIVLIANKFLNQGKTKNKIKNWLWVFFRTILIVGICYIILNPILSKISAAIRSNEDVYDSTIIWIPRHFTLENFKIAFQLLHYKVAFMDSLLLSSCSAFLQMISCALAGYGFTKIKFKGSNLLFALVILTIVIPPQTIMVPTYLHYRFFDVFGIIHLITGKKGVNLLETLWPFVISSATGMGLKSGLYIYIFKQFFRGLPKEMEEAAYVDGAGVFKTFYLIKMPNAITAMVIVLLFSFVWQWSDSYFVSLYMNNTKVLSTQLEILPGSINAVTDVPSYSSLIINAGMLLVICPIFILYLFVQKYFVESIERTGLVG